MIIMSEWLCFDDLDHNNKVMIMFAHCTTCNTIGLLDSLVECYYPARARARRACALRALGLLLYSRKGEDFLTGQLNFFREAAVTPERKVEKSFPRWEINRHA